MHGRLILLHLLVHIFYTLEDIIGQTTLKIIYYVYIPYKIFIKNSRIPILRSFKDSGMGVVLSMVCFSPSIELQKQVYNCQDNDVGVHVAYIVNILSAYRHLLTNHLHGTATELYKFKITMYNYKYISLM